MMVVICSHIELWCMYLVTCSRGWSLVVGSGGDSGEAMLMKGVSNDEPCT